MIYLSLTCRLDKCCIDGMMEMEIKKCITQNSKEHPDTFNPCPYLGIHSETQFKKGDVWKKFGEIIDKSKPKGREKLL